MIHRGPEYMGFRHVIRTVCVWIAANSALANLLPNENRFASSPKLRTCYAFLVDFVAINALNLRACLPSLQQEFLGFKRSVKRRVHDWSAEPERK